MSGCRLEQVENKIEEAFKVFGRTPLKERLDDILEQAIDLSRYRDVRDIEDKLGDLLASSIALCLESKWETDMVISKAIGRVQDRAEQYRSMGRRVNVAFLGGSFNPIHLGHIQAAQAILNASKFIDEVWLMPCNNSLYGKNLEDGHHRIEMCKLAARVDGRIKVCGWEIENNVSGETHHLLKSFLEAKDFQNYKFHFAIGLDNAYKCPNWVNWKYVERAVPFIVIPRKGEKVAEGQHWFHRAPHMILHDDNKIMEASSTDVRRALLSNKKERAVELCGQAVVDYIYEHDLYLG